MLDIEKLTNETADRVEADSRRGIAGWTWHDEYARSWYSPGIEVTAAARRAITDAALANQDHIVQELAEGRITEADLRKGIKAVIAQARHVAIEQDPEFGGRKLGRIDVRTTKEVIDNRCPYLFWC